MTTIELYRSRHRIEPRSSRRAHGPVWVCATCGIRVVMLRRGWTHDPAEVRAAARGER